MQKVQRKQAKGQMVAAETEVMQEIDSLATKAFDAELERKDHASKAAKAKKVVDSNVANINALYEDNSLSDVTNLNRKRGDKTYNIQVGNLPANSSTTVEYEKLFDDFKAGNISDAEMLLVLSKLPKTAVDQLGGAAAKYLTVKTDNTKFGLKVK